MAVDDEELLARISKLHEIYQVLVPSGGDLHLPTAFKTLGKSFSGEQQEFVSTLLRALMNWIAPASSINEEDFIRKLIRQMISSEQKEARSKVREFLSRMERQGLKAKARRDGMDGMRSVDEAECTFQPKTNGEPPKTTYTSDLEKAYADGESNPWKYTDKGYGEMPEKRKMRIADPGRTPDWVKRLYEPPREDGVQPAPEDWGRNAYRGIDGGPADLPHVTGQRLEAMTMHNWVGTLRNDAPRPPQDQRMLRNSWEDHSSVSEAGDAEVDVTPSGRRKKIYGHSTSVDSHAGFKPPKGSNVNNMATAVGVPVYKWKDRLRGGYLASKLDTSPIALAHRQRLHECTHFSFKEYRGPPSEYQPPHPYDHYTPVPVACTRHGIMHGCQ